MMTGKVEMTSRKSSEHMLSGNPVGERQSKNAADLRARRQQAVDMRIAGHTYAEIVKATKVAMRTVRDDIAIMLRERDQLLIPQLRAIEETRLDKALAAAMAVLDAYPGTELALKAVDRITRAVSVRARLLGLEAPVEVNVRTYEKTQQDLELEEILREAETHAEITRQQIMSGVAGDPDPTAG